MVGKMNDRSLFSSIGPTADGRIKPDVAAPGAGIVSAESSYALTFDKDNSVAVSTDSEGHSFYYTMNLGTSMASPFVAGTVALWLQADPTLTPDKVREIINSSSRHDSYTGDALPNNYWGAGKIDAYAGLLLAAKNGGIENDSEMDQLFRITTDRAQRSIQVFFAETAETASVAIYNSLGQQVAAQRLSHSGENINLNSASHGTYILRLTKGDSVQTIKIML